MINETVVKYLNESRGGDIVQFRYKGHEWAGYVLNWTKSAGIIKVEVIDDKGDWKKMYGRNRKIEIKESDLTEEQPFKK